MNEIVNRILDNSSALPEFTLEAGADCTLLFLNNGNGKELFYPLLPGITLAYIYINDRVWPESTKNIPLRPFLMNYCLSGRSELLLEDNTYIYFKDNDLCISRQSAKTDYIFPTRYYRGISIYIDRDIQDAADQQILETFQVDIARLQERYCGKRETYIAETAGKVKEILNKIWSLAEQPSLVYMRLYVLELLHVLLKEEETQPQNCVYYTDTQVTIAKKAEEILTADLRRHIPVRLIAEQIAVSDSSLRNYFYGVFGQNVFTYLREQRMRAAAELLADTKKSVSEIAQQVGYANQGKFAAVFKRQFSMSPLEYRRLKQLEKVRNEEYE